MQGLCYMLGFTKRTQCIFFHTRLKFSWGEKIFTKYKHTMRQLNQAVPCGMQDLSSPHLTGD